MDQYQFSNNVLDALKRWSTPSVPDDLTTMKMGDLIIDAFYKAIDRSSNEERDGRILIPTRIDSKNLRYNMLIGLGKLTRNAEIMIGRALARVMANTEWKPVKKNSFDYSWNSDFVLVSKRAEMQFIDTTASEEEIALGWKNRRRELVDIL